MAAPEATDPAKESEPASKRARVQYPPKDGQYPFPIQGPDGEIVANYLDIDSPNKDVLVRYCKEFRLQSSGKKGDLLDRLKAFSSQQDTWVDAITPGATRSHKGPRGSSKSKPKLSTQRREALMGAETTDSPTPANQTLSAMRKDNRSDKEKNKLIAFAKKICEDHPYRKYPPEQSITTSSEHVASSAPPLSPEAVMLQTKIDELGKQLTTLLSRGDDRLPHASIPYNTPAQSIVSSTPTVSLTSLSTPAILLASLSTPSDSPLPGSLSLPTVAQAPVVQPLCAPPPSISPLSTTPTPLSSSPLTIPKPLALSTSTAMRTLKLGDGTVLEYTVDEIPDPPTTTFTDLNFPRLNRMWDDTPGSSWDNSSTLIIRGRSIAAKYWPEVYRYGKPGQWEGLKCKWGDWQMILERWRKGTPEEFWAEFSNSSGKNLPMTKILKRLRAARVAEDIALAERARQEYGASFGEHFFSRQGSSLVPLTKPTAIAKRYRELKKID